MRKSSIICLATFWIKILLEFYSLWLLCDWTRGSWHLYYILQPAPHGGQSFLPFLIMIMTVEIRHCVLLLCTVKYITNLQSRLKQLKNHNCLLQVRERISGNGNWRCDNTDFCMHPHMISPGDQTIVSFYTKAMSFLQQQ